MEESLAIPSSAHELYDARGTDVSIARALMQGDVFADVVIPGLDDGTGLAMIMMHPCSMRMGPTLRKRLTVARVARHRPIALAQWPAGDYDYMPLPDLMGEGIDDPPLAANFRDVGSVKSVDLDVGTRIAALSALGVQYLQQRHVHSQTRLVVDLETLLAHILPVLDEVELQEEWAESAFVADDGNSGELDVVRRAEGEFQDFMGESDSVLRQGLKNPSRRAEVRRAVRAELKKQYPR